MAEMPSIPRASFGASPTRQRGLPDVNKTVPTSLDLVVDSVVSRPLAALMASSAPRTARGVVIELRSDHPEGVAGASADILGWLSDIAPKAAVRRGQSSVSNYVSAGLTASQIRQLVQADREVDVRAKDLSLGATHDATVAPTAAGSRPAPRYAIDRMWPNVVIHNLIHRGVVTTKSDAAQRAFEATSEGIVWAVLDSGFRPTTHISRRTATPNLPGQLKHMDFTDGSSDPLIEPRPPCRHGGRRCAATGPGIS